MKMEPTPISARQLKLLQLLLRQRVSGGRSDRSRSARLAWCEHILGRDVPTTTGLTKTEAATVINSLIDDDRQSS